MTTISGPLAGGIEGRLTQPQTPQGNSFWSHGHGIKSWLFTLDHKRIGILYMVSVLSAFLIGGCFAIGMRTMLLTPGQSHAPAGQNAGMLDLYNHMFTLHGVIMVFAFLVPVIPGVLGNFFVPLMLGAKDLAFPKLNLLSWYCYIGGAAFLLWILGKGVLVAAFPVLGTWIGQGGLDTGWTFYTPYSTSFANSGVVSAFIGVFILGFSSILTAVNFIATTHMLRPRGMGFFKLPLTIWALYATSILQILATPVLAITLLLLIAETTLGVGIFDPALGGDPVLFQHFFWFYSHPAVYIMALPAMGLISELISTFSRKHIFGYKFIAISSIAIAMFSFLVWGHHMFTSGQSPLINTLFSLFSMAVAIPSAIKVFNWLATIYRGTVRLDTPMLYGLGFLWLFTIGGLTGVFLATLNVDTYFHDTYFVVAHFHYIMVGSTLFAFIGAMYYWFPKMFGKMCNEKLGKIAWTIIFIGFNLTFFVQFIAGAQGMPRRYANYLPQYQPYHVISTIGAYILAIGLFTVLFNWIHALKKGRPAPANPWGSNSLEWHTSSPPPHQNFDVTPEGVDPYDYRHWRYNAQIDGYEYDEQTAAEAAPVH